MGFDKIIVITAIVILSLAVGYLKGNQKKVALLILGVILAFYAIEYLGLMNGIEMNK